MKGSIPRRLLPVTIAVLSGFAIAAEIDVWRTPSGALHFGDDPPQGSVREGSTGPLETLGGVVPPKVAVPKNELGIVERRKERRREERDEREARRAEHREAVRILAVATSGRGRLTIHSGVVENTSDAPVTGIQVGDGYRWERTTPPVLGPGQTATFVFHRDDLTREANPLQVRWTGSAR